MSFHYWQPALRCSWLANPGDPAMSPQAVRVIVTCHTLEAVERGRGTAWVMCCH